MAEQTSLSEIQNFLNLPLMERKEIIPESSWIYETLEDFTKKYGGSINEEKPLSRSEATYILINLIGRIQEEGIKVSEADKALLKVLKKELNEEITKLNGRIEFLEESTETLSGKVTQLEKGSKKNLKVNYGEDFNIAGSFQAQYTGVTNKGGDNYPSNFKIPLSEIMLSGKLKPKLSYNVNFVTNSFFNNSSLNGVIEDAFIQAELFPHHTVDIGQTVLPIGYEGPLDPTLLETIDKAQYARNYGDRPDLGVKLNGIWDFINYNLAIYNGNGANNDDTNNKLATLGWFSVKPFYKKSQILNGLETGAGYYTGQNQTNNENILSLYSGYTFKKLKLRSEYSKIKGYQNAQQKGEDLYGLISYDLSDKWAILGRYDYFIPDMTIKQSKNTEYTIGANYKMSENTMLKLNFVHVINKTLDDSQRINIVTQYKF